MSRHHIPAKLKRIAFAKERAARSRVVRTSREVSAATTALTELDEAHADAEESLMHDAPPIDGARLQVLGVGRESWSAEHTAGAHYLEDRRSVLALRREDHERLLRDRHARDKLYTMMRERLRQSVLRKDQREQDDLTASRHVSGKG